MRIVRFELQETAEQFYGVLTNEHVTKITGDIYGDFQLTNRQYPLAVGRLLAPITPVNIIAIGLNYRRHALESGNEIPEQPVIFLKTTNSVIGPDESITLPKNHPDEVDYEAELAVIIGKTAKDIPEERALDYVLGYTCSNDVSARDCQLRFDVQWARGKSFDTFCPLGPWIETELDPADLAIKTHVNGQTLQASSTADMIFSVPYLVSYLSYNMTLLPGTVILTGTPEGVGMAREPQVYLQDGDLVEIEIGWIGTLKNSVKNAL